MVAAVTGNVRPLRPADRPEPVHIMLPPLCGTRKRARLLAERAGTINGEAVVDCVDLLAVTVAFADTLLGELHARGATRVVITNLTVGSRDVGVFATAAGLHVTGAFERDWEEA